MRYYSGPRQIWNAFFLKCEYEDRSILVLSEVVLLEPCSTVVVMRLCYTLGWQSDDVIAKPFVPLGSRKAAANSFLFNALCDDAVSICGSIQFEDRSSSYLH